MKNMLFILSFVICIVIPFHRTNAQVPEIGAEVWLEPQYSKSHIDTLFRLLADHNMPVARIFIGQGDLTVYDNAFVSAQKYGVKIQATLSVPEYPQKEEDLVRYAAYIKRIVSRYKNHPALETWWLINEPGKGASATPLAMQKFREWLMKKYSDINVLNSLWRSNYLSFSDVQYNENWTKTANFSNTTDYFDWFLFARDYLTWIQQWIASEVSREDTLHPFHVNPHAIFTNLILYDFPAWRNFLSSLGASIHPSWHFTLLKRNQFAMGVAATCDIIRGGSEPNPIWVSELQGGNNTWSGIQPLGPEAEDIAQWVWTSIGSGAEKVIFWLLNNRLKGGESGEWSMLDFQGNPSDRLLMASKIAQTIEKEKTFFEGAKPLERKVVILLSSESTLILARKATGSNLAGRSANAHILSALAYYEALSEMGIPAVFKYTDDFEWESKTGYLAIFPDAVAVPRRVVDRAEKFVANGNKLIIDGLTGYFDENEVNVIQSGFFFEKLCGATVKEIRAKTNLFSTNVDQVTLPAHLWQTEILNRSAAVTGRDGERITSVRNSFGKGEVVWIPALAGLGAWLDKNNALASVLKRETEAIRQQLPVQFSEKTSNVVLSTLQKGSSFISILTNGSDQQRVVSLQAEKSLQPSVIFDTQSNSSKFSPFKVTLAPRQTMVIKWSPVAGKS